MVVGEDAPPMHPFCRCSVAAAMPDEEFKELTGVDQVKLDLKAINQAAVEKYTALDDLPKSSKSIVPIRTTDYNEFKEKAKSIIPITMDDLPDFMKAKPAERKNSQVLIDYINSQENADPRVKSLYKNFGNFANMQSTGNMTKLSHASGHAVKYSYSMRDGSVQDITLCVPKLTGDDVNGAVATTLHEDMHYVDLCLRSNDNGKYTYEQMYSSLNTELHKIFQTTDIFMSDDVKAVISDFHTELDVIEKKYREKFRTENNTLHDQVMNGEIFYAEYKKKFSKLKKEVTEGLDYENRNAGGGNVCGLKDIYDALSGGHDRDTGVVRYGHGSQYYADVDDRVCETIANYASLSITRPDLVELLKKDKPELTEALDNLIDEMIKKVSP